MYIMQIKLFAQLEFMTQAELSFNLYYNIVVTFTIK